MPARATLVTVTVRAFSQACSLVKLCQKWPNRSFHGYCTTAHKTDSKPLLGCAIRSTACMFWQRVVAAHEVGKSHFNSCMCRHCLFGFSSSYPGACEPLSRVSQLPAGALARSSWGIAASSVPLSTSASVFLRSLAKNTPIYLALTSDLIWSFSARHPWVWPDCWSRSHEMS